MTFDALFSIAEAALAASRPEPEQVAVAFSAKGNLYTILSNEYTPVLNTMKANEDTHILKLLTLWNNGGTDLPSYAFRTALRRLDPANNDTELCFGSTSKPLAATMYHPKYDLISLKEYPELLDTMAVWFHQKWGIPEEAYRESMEDCLHTDHPVPRWYLVMDGDTIAGGLGVIENDFHLRRDLTPNVCAVYVEEAYRKQGIAGWMLTRVCNEYQSMGIDTLYLSTDHTSFYERYGWEFYCMAQEEGSECMTRMYRKITR